MLTFMHHTCDRLNGMLSTTSCFSKLLDLWVSCDLTDSVDMLSLGGSCYVTNFASVLNGFMAFRDEVGRTYRLTPIFSTQSSSENCKVICKFIVTVSLSTQADEVFPLFL